MRIAQLASVPSVCAEPAVCVFVFTHNAQHAHTLRACAMMKALVELDINRLVCVLFVYMCACVGVCVALCICMRE